MKVTYTGRQVELSPAQSLKLTTGFTKVGKLLDNGKGEAEAHVTLSLERHLNNVEITVPYLHHELIGDGSDPDLFTAIHAAIDKLEKQAIRVREKRRDGKRIPWKETNGSSETETAEPAVAARSGEDAGEIEVSGGGESGGEKG